MMNLMRYDRQVRFDESSFTFINTLSLAKPLMRFCSKILGLKTTMSMMLRTSCSMSTLLHRHLRFKPGKRVEEQEQGLPHAHCMLLIVERPDMLELEKIISPQFQIQDEIFRPVADNTPIV